MNLDMNIYLLAYAISWYLLPVCGHHYQHSRGEKLRSGNEHKGVLSLWFKVCMAVRSKSIRLY